MYEPGEEAGPLTSFERGFYTLLLTIVLGLFAAEIIRDYHPGKLAAFFFVLFWPPLVVVHELGHASMAWLLGWRVRRIVIGLNREVWRTNFGGCRVEWRLLPLGGYVLPSPGNLIAPRLKNALIYAAGPGVELLLLGVLVLALGPAVFLDYSEDLGVVALKALALVILYGAITNLIPLPITVGGKFAVSDGLGIIRSFTLSDDDFRSMMFSPEEEEEEENKEDY